MKMKRKAAAPKRKPPRTVAVKLPTDDVRLSKRKAWIDFPHDELPGPSLDCVRCERGFHWHVFANGQIWAGCKIWKTVDDALFHYQPEKYVDEYVYNYKNEWCGEPTCRSCFGSEKAARRVRTRQMERCIQRIKWLEQRRKRWLKTMQIKVG